MGRKAPEIAKEPYCLVVRTDKKGYQHYYETQRPIGFECRDFIRNIVKTRSNGPVSPKNLDAQFLTMGIEQRVLAEMAAKTVI